MLALGPGLTWNVFDYDRVENNVRVQDARYQQLAELYRDTVLQAARDVDSSAIALLKNREQLVINEEVTVAAQRALDIASLQYREGFSDFSRVLDAQRSYFSQTERVVGNRSNMVLSLIALYKALGGGWEPGRLRPLVDDATRQQMQARHRLGRHAGSTLAISRRASGRVQLRFPGMNQNDNSQHAG